MSLSGDAVVGEISFHEKRKARAYDAEEVWSTYLLKMQNDSFKMLQEFMQKCNFG
jgi:hypothetical protein